MNGYYTTGEFAKKANVSVRTIRYYDKQELLKPAFVNESGYRMYTDSDFAKLQEILSLKYLGFSLDEIRSITINAHDSHYVDRSLRLQQRLVGKKIEHLKLVERTLRETSRLIREGGEVDWNEILHLIHVTNMERTLVEQYKNAANIGIRIQLHKRYAVNREGWFEWIYRNLELAGGESVLEVGCGSGELWKVNRERILPGLKVLLSDLSEGMIRDARDNLGDMGDNFSYEVFGCGRIPAANKQFDVVVANHVLFYLKDLDGALGEIRRVLKDGGLFCCSTYGREHMKEISQLVREFDPRISLSEVALYDEFGLENGQELLEPFFGTVERRLYDDCLEVDQAGPLMEYILSCHGNQKEHLNSRYEEFRVFLQQKIDRKGAITITKQAGIFCCR